jgi:hypothetical protein
MHIVLYTFESENDFLFFKNCYLNHRDIEVDQPLHFPCVGVLQCTEEVSVMKPGRFIPPGSKLKNYVYLSHFGIETSAKNEYLEQYL